MRVADHVVRARRRKLADLLARHHYLSLGELCDRLEVSAPTARRDLAALAAEQAITRTHGGALVEYNQKFDSFRERIGRAADVKRRLGDAAARLLKPGQTVWLDGGTTVYYVAEALADRRPRGLVVVTHNMPAAELLADFDDVEVHLLGGQYFRRTSLLLGPRTVGAARRWRFDAALLGIEGIDRSGLWNSLRDVVLLQRAVMRASVHNVVLADAVKFGRRAPEFLCPADGVDHVLSDASPSDFEASGLRPGQRLDLDPDAKKGERKP